jgi:O-methyltransferase
MTKTVRWRNLDIPVPPLDMSNHDIADRNEFFRRASCVIKYNGIKGDYAEFGCASATTFRLAHSHIKMQQLNMKMWAFDSFEGLPKTDDVRDLHPQWYAGAYPTATDLFELIVDDYGIKKDNYSMVPGFYNDTIGKKSIGSDKFAPEIAIAYIDCDLFSSTRDVLFFLKSRLKTGIIIAFDDYFCYSSHGISGERLAMLDFLKENDEWEFVPFYQFNWHGQSFMVENKKTRNSQRSPE